MIQHKKHEGLGCIVFTQVGVDRVDSTKGFEAALDGQTIALLVFGAVYFLDEQGAEGVKV